MRIDEVRTITIELEPKEKQTIIQCAEILDNVFNSMQTVCSEYLYGDNFGCPINISLTQIHDTMELLRDLLFVTEMD